MEYQKVINLLDDTLNQSSKFRTRNLIEMMHLGKHVMSVIKLKLKFQ